MPDLFDDFLGLAARDFARHRLVVFRGCSGSGKSTAIDWLLRSHPDFVRKDVTRMDGPPLIAPESLSSLTVVDEIVSPRELPLVARFLARGATLLVATHLSPAWFRPFQMAVRTSIFTTDVDRAKIARHLGRLGLPATPRAVDLYVRRFGANYTDIDIILERCPAPTFDAALATFTKFCSVAMG